MVYRPVCHRAIQYPRCPDAKYPDPRHIRRHIRGPAPGLPLILSPRVAFAILMLVFSIFGAIEYSRMTGSKSTLLRLFDIVATALPPFFVLMAVKATGLSTTTIAWGAGSVCFLYPFFRMGAQLYVKSPAP